LLLVTAVSAVFQYRYLLPVLVLLPAGGALGLELLVRRAQGAGGRAAATGADPPSAVLAAPPERVGPTHV